MDDGWAEFARWTLERDASPLYENQLPLYKRTQQFVSRLMRDATGRLIRRVQSEQKSEQVANSSEQPPLGVWRV